MDELVVCIEDRNHRGWPKVLNKGAIYTVVGVCNKHRGRYAPGYLLAELGKIAPKHCGCYSQKLFRPIRRPDISALRELARETTLRCQESPIWLDWARKAGV